MSRSSSSSVIAATTFSESLVDQVALAGTGRADQKHSPRRPVGPAVDQPDGFAIGIGNEKIGAGHGGAVRQFERKLVRRRRSLGGHDCFGGSSGPR
jgi:hypothetical protein